MGWERGKYYTRSRRVNGQVVREYYGCGLLGEMASLVDEMDREDREWEQECWQTEQALLQEFDDALDSIDRVVDAVTRAAFLSNGYHFHRGEWRLKRG